MNKSKKKMIALILTVTTAAFAAVAFAAEPGSSDDPLVTKSYIDNAINQVKSYVEETLKNLENNETENTAPPYNASFEIVRLGEGQRIVFGESAEFIVRMGKGAVIASEKGGIADVTAGFDLTEGEVTSANHLMIVPVGDGRGFEALEDVIVMVKGSYQIN